MIKNFFKKSSVAQSSEQAVKEMIHELRTHLSTIRSGISGVKDYVPKLLDAYKIAAEQKIDVPEILPHCLESLYDALERSNKEAVNTSLYIWILGMNLSGINSPIALIELSAREIITKALNTFPCNNTNQRSILNIPLKFKDFYFKGNEEYILNVFYNLIRFSLCRIFAAGDGKITIETREDKRNNCIFIRYNGKEIPKKIANNLFNLDTLGMGDFMFGMLFCKKTMKSFGGRISCCSDNKKYTEFTLTFPVIRG